MIAANDVASVLIARHGSWMDAWKLQKLLYYVQAWHMAIADRPAFDEPIKAYKDGPVVPDVRHKRMGQPTRRPSYQSLDDIRLDSFASDLIDLVLAHYGDLSGAELRALTHAESPWLDARGDLPEDASSSTPISLASMARFYRDNGQLGGRTAADLAAGGLHVASGRPDTVDVDALLDEVDDATWESGEDSWGGANLLARYTA